VEYDRPSSLFGQFGNVNVTEVAATLDRKLERLVADAMQGSRAAGATLACVWNTLKVESQP
jgi:hypothetical protein